MDKIKSVLVLFGGVSTEHKISCRSARTIIQGLKNVGYDVNAVGITLDGEWVPFLAELDNIVADNWVELAKATLEEQGFAEATRADLSSPKAFLTYHAGGNTPDVVFNAMHGINSEDGVIQGFLETTGFPYTGSDVLSSAVSMDKAFTKLVLNNTDVPQLDFILAERHVINSDIEVLVNAVEKKFGYPVFLKPANGGSSVGTYKVDSDVELRESLLEACHYDNKILIEPFYDAREIEVAVLGNKNPRVALPGEIIMDADVEYYDYETKYINTDSSLAIPADLRPETIDKLQRYAEEVYTILACDGYARVDFFVANDESEIFFNEINTLPGFTSISLFPSAWAKEGYSLEDLLRTICELAYNAHEDGKKKTDV